MSILSGSLALMAIQRLAKDLKLDNISRYVLIVTSITLILSFSLTVVTADILFTGILLLYICILIEGRKPVTCALLGAILYFTKSYGFVFFLISFSAFYLRASTLKQYAIGIFAFLILGSPWISLITLKYQRLTIGTAAEYNLALSHPDNKNLLILKPFFPPPNSTALSAWEDPYLMIDKT